MINTLRQLSRGRLYMAIFSFFLLGGIVLLAVEFYRFKKVAVELRELKEEYRVYTLALKKTLYDQTATLNELRAEQKKKIIEQGHEDQDEGAFCMVNRESDYLLEHALAYAKQHNIESDVARLLDVAEWEKRVRPHLQKKRTKNFIGTASKGRHYTSTKTVKDYDFAWPVDRSRFWLSSLFGPRKMKGLGVRYHYGIDMAALKGTPVKAAATGIVLESYWNNGYGNCIIVAHNRKYKTRYAHLDTRRVRVGQKVKKGEIIGTVGDTGLVRKSGKDASHLHFEVYAFGRRINPLSVLS